MRWRPKAGMETFNTTTQGIRLLSSEAEAAKDINMINYRFLDHTHIFCVLLNYDIFCESTNTTTKTYTGPAYCVCRPKQKPNATVVASLGIYLFLKQKQFLVKTTRQDNKSKDKSRRATSRIYLQDISL